jgi:hypothetical protein
MNAIRHPLVEQLAAAQQAERQAATRTIDASAAFVQRRTLAASHALGRRLLAWAGDQRVAAAPCFRALGAAIAAGELISDQLMACWTDFPACQVVA